MTVVCVGCGRARVDEPTRAGEMYQSGYFRKKKKFALQHDEWYILTVKHGLLDPDEVIEPYSRQIKHVSYIEAHRWGQETSAAINAFDDHVIVLAIDGFTRWLRDADAEFPFDHIDHTLRLRWLPTL